MKLLKRSIPLWVVLLIILVSGSALALVYMTAQMTMQATIVAKGTIKVYSDSACTIELPLPKDWGDFDPSGGDQSKTLEAWIKNIGNSKAYLRYFVTPTSWVWTTSPDNHYGKGFFWLYLKYGTTPVDWIPKDGAIPTVVQLNVGENVKITFTLTAKSGGTPTTESFTANFESSDA